MPAGVSVINVLVIGIRFVFVIRISFGQVGKNPNPSEFQGRGPSMTKGEFTGRQRGVGEGAIEWGATVLSRCCINEPPADLGTTGLVS